MSRPVFILATDLRPGEADWASMETQAAVLQGFAHRALGVPVWVDLACIAARSTEDPGEFQIGRVIDRRIRDGASLLFVMPAAFEQSIWQRTMLGEELGARGAGTPGPRSIMIPSSRRIRCSSIVSPARSCRPWASGASTRETPEWSLLLTDRVIRPPVRTPIA